MNLERILLLSLRLLMVLLSVNTGSLYSQAPNIPELADLTQTFIAKKAEIQKPISDLAVKYRAALEKSRDESTAAGKLDAVLAAVDSLNALDEGVVERQLDKKGTEAARLRTIYLRQKEELTRQEAPLILRVTGAYIEQLNTLATKLTKEKKIPEATVVAGELDTVKLETVKPSATLGAIRTEVRDLVNQEWVYAFAPPRSKPMTFLPNGDIGDGQNPQEAKWEYRSPYLLIFLQTGEVGRAFVYDHVGKKWIGTSKTKSSLSSEGCYIVRRPLEKK